MLPLTELLGSRAGSTCRKTYQAFYQDTNITTAKTGFFPVVGITFDAGDQTTAAKVGLLVTEAGTVKNARLRVMGGSQPTLEVAENVTFTLVKNGVDTALTLVIDDTHDVVDDAVTSATTVAVAAGDVLAWKYLVGGTLEGTEDVEVALGFDVEVS